MGLRWQADFLDSQWDSAHSTWLYWDDWVDGDAQVSLDDMRNLALLFLVPYYQAAHDGYGSSYLEKPAAAAAMHAAQAPMGAISTVSSPAWSLKIFTEGYYLCRYAEALRAGL